MTQRCNLWCLNANMEKWCVVSPAFPEPQPTGASGWRMRTGFKGISPSHSLTASPQRTSEGKRSILWERTAQPLSPPRTDPNANSVSLQKQIHLLRNGGATSSYMKRPAKQKIALWGPQILCNRLNRVKRENAGSWKLAPCQYLTQNGSLSESIHWLSTYGP